MRPARRGRAPDGLRRPAAVFGHAVPPMRALSLLHAATVLLIACGGAGPGLDAGADAGSGATDAGPRDAGTTSSDAGAPDAGPAEPRTSSAILWRDDFEAYASTMALLAVYPDSREAGGRLSHDDGALRVDYFADGGCADADLFVAKSFAGDVPELVVSTTFKLSSGFRHLQPPTHCGGTGAGTTELVLSRPGDGPGRVTVEARLDTEGLGFLVRVGSLEFTQQSRRGTRSPGVLAPDTWHRLTLVVVRESAAGQGDGALRLWVDGVAVLEVPRAATGAAPFARLAVPGPLAAGASVPQTRWLDEVTVFTP